ncbi:MAG: single-stranded-DNA-specific exonuclease RecJ, partial [Verrucomicrobia bacterium]|nr:single-stranded-DNA-specific exonuclease RecJ [Cytophagales bacterium]
AVAVLDAKQADCEYPYKYLSGCGVGFKLMQAFCIRQAITLENLYEYLDLVALSIASDIVPISGENRILAYFGLKKLNQNPCVGLKALREIAGIKPEKELNINNVVFMLGPRINAAGRVEHADTAVHLMLAEEETEAENFAQQLNKQNTSRREFDASMMDEAMEIMRTNLSFQHMKTTVLFGENWNKGVIGIVASRLIEHYHRPTIVLTKNHGKLTGSARSVQGFDVHAAISQCADLLDQFGGHNFAAGLSMPEENLEAFRERFEQVVTNMISKEMLVPSLNVDMPLHLGQINNRMLQIIKQMAPFGPDNVEPTFVSEKVWLSQPTYTMKDKHLKLRIHQPGSDDFDAVAFGMSDFKNKLSLQKPFDICYHINENHYNDHVSLQLMIKDIKV